MGELEKPSVYRCGQDKGQPDRPGPDQEVALAALHLGTITESGGGQLPQRKPPVSGRRRPGRHRQQCPLQAVQPAAGLSPVLPSLRLPCRTLALPCSLLFLLGSAPLLACLPEPLPPPCRLSPEPPGAAPAAAVRLWEAGGGQGQWRTRHRPGCWEGPSRCAGEHLPGRRGWVQAKPVRTRWQMAVSARIFAGSRG